ncbi:glycosyltransferase [Pontibacter sp. Tf4]|uniref:cellulose synthase family protein n=1 Tax=Pontibacter sp. Tf4 TaxID=2761620 RepID=UPI001624469B|nr:cellulose synthase family protein [Pontibacter sp. Tf4]MBB6612571.1 glycosyltransferase [Pontibacter sp. Tf4]
MTLAATLVIVIYSLCLAFIFCYSLVQLHLTWLYLYGTRQQPKPTIAFDAWPAVTVQLPVYNERYVVERLLEAVAAFDYPADKLQIQLLDDSTDDTTYIISRKIKELAPTGIQIEHIRRRERTGFKAGALQHGLQTATGTFIAIFDADFTPAPDFLKQTIVAFTKPEIGVVQTRWGHLNKNYSLLTRLQAFGLDAHFTIEQQGRNNGHFFMNFNGTAGVWRKSCIVDAGGWHADTLTEDLDLSYRAQLKGWQFVYQQQTEAPAELPAAMGALKSQQYRWTKGAAETARKHLANVLTSSKTIAPKLHATFHLLNSGVFICVLLTAVLSIPMLYIKHDYPNYSWLFNLGAFLIISLFSLVLFYWIAAGVGGKRSFRQFIPDFLLFLSMSMGMSLHNSVAVLEGYLGRKTPFIRTPKYNIVQAQDRWQQKIYTLPGIGLLSWLEGLLALYFVWGIWLGFRLGDYGLLPFHVMLALGFGLVFCYSLVHSRKA